MKHNLNIRVSKDLQDDGIVACKNIGLREKLLSKLLGVKRKVVVLVPGDSLVGITITEVSEGGEENERND